MPAPNRPEERQVASASSAAQHHSASGAGAARKEDNIYIPSFISKKPFYVDDVGDDQDDSLRHQRSQYPTQEEERTSLLTKGRKTGPARTKWVKGACENCGALGHKKKDCLERPRKVGAKFSGKDIQADRVAQAGRQGYEAKRDIYQTYDPKQYQEVVEEYNLIEEARRQMIQAATGGGTDGVKGDKGPEDGEPKNEYEEGFKYAEESELGRDKSIKQSMRLREDTAKYLLNLDSDSAKYNPKKRALVDAGAIDDKSAALFAEESFLRASGEAAEFEKAQRYAWEAQEKAGDTSLHLQANPTAGAVMRKKEVEERETKRQKRAEMLASQYGEQPNVSDALKAVTITENEAFVEYDEAGLIKGAPRKAAKSKYAEDVLINNHAAVWGSWWSEFKWGYACCHSFLKNSYCTGETGKTAAKESEVWNQ
ncbi:Pre-mRNA splicing Prp18-interacting factor-domain-containing protein [Schizothecium vesticola]|uniref:Pre-mRNA-splicing factor SLU7 n=1 Tax=Schizothecium vesticola TaxID=314040 RepID=A0AA40F999_9PEZI|nr:Pre-mRNA splicing Prp18-interacting factor-domain-containing protein [Schizothecium vesticola]